jgi:hypothetical protein
VAAPGDRVAVGAVGAPPLAQCAVWQRVDIGVGAVPGDVWDEVVHDLGTLAEQLFEFKGGIVSLAWLKRDGRNRFVRTIEQAIAATVLIPASDAAIQVIQRALVDSMSGKPFDVHQVAVSAGWSAGVGITMAVLAYVHRVKVDPSPFPSSPPPIPPGARPVRTP